MCEGSFLPSSFGPHQKHTEFESGLRSYPINPGWGLLFGLEVAMQWMMARSEPALSFMVLFLLQFIVLAPPTSAQATQRTPLPEYFGLYALDKENLIALHDGKS